MPADAIVFIRDHLITYTWTKDKDKVVEICDWDNLEWGYCPVCGEKIGLVGMPFPAKCDECGIEWTDNTDTDAVIKHFGGVNETAQKIITEASQN